MKPSRVAATCSRGGGSKASAGSGGILGMLSSPWVILGALLVGGLVLMYVMYNQSQLSKQMSDLSTRVERQQKELQAGIHQSMQAMLGDISEYVDHKMSERGGRLPSRSQGRLPPAVTMDSAPRGKKTPRRLPSRVEAATSAPTPASDPINHEAATQELNLPMVRAPPSRRRGRTTNPTDDGDATALPTGITIPTPRPVGHEQPEEKADVADDQGKGEEETVDDEEEEEEGGGGDVDGAALSEGFALALEDAREQEAVVAPPRLPTAAYKKAAVVHRRRSPRLQKGK